MRTSGRLADNKCGLREDLPTTSADFGNIFGGADFGNIRVALADFGLKRVFLCLETSGKLVHPA